MEKNEKFFFNFCPVSVFKLSPLSAFFTRTRSPWPPWPLLSLQHILRSGPVSNCFIEVFKWWKCRCYATLEIKIWFSCTSAPLGSQCRRANTTINQTPYYNLPSVPPENCVLFKDCQCEEDNSCLIASRELRLLDAKMVLEYQVSATMDCSFDMARTLWLAGCANRGLPIS